MRNALHRWGGVGMRTAARIPTERIVAEESFWGVLASNTQRSPCELGGGGGGRLEPHNH